MNQTGQPPPILEERNNLYTWFGIAQILILLACLSKNLQKLHNARIQIANSRQKDLPARLLKKRFLITLSLASGARIATILILLGGPSTFYQYLCYTFPIVIWINAKAMFMGFLGQIYRQLSKSEPLTSIKTIMDWSGQALVLIYVMFIIMAFFKQDPTIVMLDLLVVNVMSYLALLGGNIFYSYHLYSMLQEEQQIAGLLAEFKKLIFTISGLYAVRVVFSFLVSMQLMPFNNDILLLMEIWFSEVMPYLYMVSTKLQMPDKPEEAGDTMEMKDIKKGIDQQLLDKRV